MAFVFRAPKKDTVKVDSQLPGPGQYIGPEIHTPEQNRIPFHSSAPRQEVKQLQDPNIGPGSYNIAKDLLAPEKTQNVFFMPADPDKEAEQVKATNVFKSKAKRFENKNIKEGPGPGTYYKESSFGKKLPPNYRAASQPNRLYNMYPYQEKTLIPSIPGGTHSYGYTENDEHALVLNKDPLAQAPQYVGPGYYEVKTNSQASKYKGHTWSKSKVKKLDSLAGSNTTTPFVGPGTYETNETNDPSYKNKPQAGFASTTTRTFDSLVKQKLGYSKFQSRTPLSSQSEAGARGISAAETDADMDDDDEYIKDATPGPGYYYNESMLSSFMKSPSSEFSIMSSSTDKKGKQLGFGRCARFKENNTTTKELGPGDYEVKLTSKQIEMKAKVPFQSSNTRFDRVYPKLQPGPGTYNPPINLVDRVKDKAKSGYVGSFGITEKRFKVSKLLEETPGPGVYTQENQKSYVEDITAAFRKGSHYFTSSSQRIAFDAKAENVPSPGTYNLGYYDISKKAAKEEDEGDLPKRYPFNSGQERFEKPKEKVIPEDDDEDEDDEPRFGVTRNLESLLKSKMKGKPNAVFQSTTGRAVVGQKNVAPGPGAYHDASQNLWNKRTFNIHFTGD